MGKRAYLVIGCPGSGKSWVCDQLKELYEYVHHDAHIGQAGGAYVESIKSAAATATKDLLIEAPFSVSQIKDPVEAAGIEVIPLFIQEDHSVIANRYLNRDNREIPRGHLSRQNTYLERANEWGAFKGTSNEVLERLKQAAGEDGLKQNAIKSGVVMYGLHFCEGVARYDGPDGSSQTIFISDDTIRKMGPSFAGRPLHVNHINDDDPSTPPPDGYVVESFFNEPDGKHWSKFIMTTDKAMQAKANGWTLSNAYRITNSGPGGKWHNVDYQQEVLAGVFMHLAMVPNPRYDESIVLTPEEFKAYNLRKTQELKLLANSKGDHEAMSLKFWKRSKVENGVDLEDTMVSLPTGGDKSLKEIISEHGELSKQVQNSSSKMNMDEKIKVGDDEMSVNELVSKYNAMVAEKKNADDADKAKAEKDAADKKNAEDEAAKKAKDEQDKKNADEEAAKKKAEDDKQNGLKHFETLKNALAKEASEAPVETSEDKVARGKARYGSAS